jgi:hypothetical protein
VGNFTFQTAGAYLQFISELLVVDKGKQHPPARAIFQALD